MQVIQAQHLSVFDRKARHTVAAVEIHELCDARLDRKAPPQAAFDRQRRARQKTRARRAVRTDEWIKQERGIIIDGKHAVGVRVDAVVGAQELHLIDMIGARGVKVYLLQQQQIRLKRLNHHGDLVKIFPQTLLRPRPRLGSAVHEEAVIVLIRTEADVPADKCVAFSGLRLLRLPGSDGERLVVLDAVIVRKHIGDIRASDQHEHQQHDPDDFAYFFHGSLLITFLILLYRTVGKKQPHLEKRLPAW